MQKVTDTPSEVAQRHVTVTTRQYDSVEFIELRTFEPGKQWYVPEINIFGVKIALPYRDDESARELAQEIRRAMEQWIIEHCTPVFNIRYVAKETP
jgi:hypothetical protein